MGDILGVLLIASLIKSCCAAVLRVFEEAQGMVLIPGLLLPLQQISPHKLTWGIQVVICNIEHLELSKEIFTGRT